MMSILEQRFMERMPILLNELIKKVDVLTENIKELNERLDKMEQKD